MEPRANEDDQEVSAASATSKRELGNTKRVQALEEGAEKLVKHALNHLGENRRDVNTSLVAWVGHRFLFVKRHNPV